MLARCLNIILGLWLMVAPAILGLAGDDPAAINDWIVGPIAATFATIALWEPTRSLRFANLVLGLWLVVAPWLLGYDDTLAILNDSVVGLLLFAFATVRGATNGRYGGGWSAVWRRGDES